MDLIEPKGLKRVRGGDDSNESNCGCHCSPGSADSTFDTAKEHGSQQ